MNRLRRTVLDSILASALVLVGCGSSTPSNQSTPAPANISKQDKVVYEIATLKPSMIETPAEANVKINGDGSISVGKSDRVPHIYEGAKKWAEVNTKAIESPQEFQTADIRLDEVLNDPKDEVQVEVSTSGDGNDWSEFVMLGKGATEFGLIGSAKYIKYRITLISYTSGQPPLLKNISIQLKRRS